MRKIISLLSITLLSCGFAKAMEGDVPTQRSTKVVEKLSFENIQVLWKLYNLSNNAQERQTLRSNIIIGLNSLMKTEDLQENHKKEALEIAKALEAANLNVRLKAYYEKVTLDGPMNVLPADIQKMVIVHFSEGGSVRDILSLLSVNKSFNMLLLKAPLAIDLSSDSKGITNAHLEKLVQLFPNTEKLSLAYTGVTDLSSLSNLKNLLELNLENTKIMSLSPLSHLPRLSILNLESTQISDLNPLAKLISLTELNLESTPIYDLKPLTGLINLKRLNLNQTGVFDLSPLVNLTKLTHLNLKSISISDPSPLSALAALESLDLSWARIKDLSPLVKLPRLTSLDLSWAEYPEEQSAELKIVRPSLVIKTGEETIVVPPPPSNYDGFSSMWYSATPH